MEKDIKDSLLLDFYSNMLTPRQKEVMRLYIECDTSLSEIASMLGTTRQAVYDIVKVSMKLLESYEGKLKCVERFVKNRELLSRSKTLVDKIALETNDERLKAVSINLDKVIKNQ